MRVKRGPVTHRRHKRVLKLAKGYRGQRSRSFRKAKEQLLHSYVYNYNHRKDRKGDFKKLWIMRVNARVRLSGINYSSFMHCLKQSGLNLNLKVLADMATHRSEDFDMLVKSIIKKDNRGIKV